MLSTRRTGWEVNPRFMSEPQPFWEVEPPDFATP